MIQLHTFTSPAADRHLATSNPSLQSVVSFTKSVKTPISHHPRQCLGSEGKSGSLKAPNLLTLSLNDLLPAEIWVLQSTLMFKTNLIDLSYFFILNNSQDQTLLIEINLIYDFKVSVHLSFFYCEHERREQECPENCTVFLTVYRPSFFVKKKKNHVFIFKKLQVEKNMFFKQPNKDLELGHCLSGFWPWHNTEGYPCKGPWWHLFTITDSATTAY